MLSLHRQQSGANPTLDKNFQQPNSDRQLLRSEQAVDRLENRHRVRQQAADSVEKLCFLKALDLICDLSGF